jgi:FtsH-binding integral membrane protein
MSAGTATALFVRYSALNGLTLSFIFLVYTTASIGRTFFICAGTFIACSVYGWTTKRDLTSFGGFLMMGLFGIIIATVVNIFLRSDVVTMAVTYLGVFIFVGLTAYDTQKIKNMALTQPDGLDGQVVRKGAILGALSLYLDFINLFLMLLRIFGSARD